MAKILSETHTTGQLHFNGTAHPLPLAPRQSQIPVDPDDGGGGTKEKTRMAAD